METEISPPKELADKFLFTVDTKRLGSPKWIIACRKCEAKWSRHVGEMPVGGILTLLNHAASHK